MNAYKKIEDYNKEELDSLVGKSCKFYANSDWWGAYTNERFIWLCGKISRVSWGKDDVFKKEGTMPAIYITSRRNKKLGVERLENVCFLPLDVKGNIIVKQ